MSDPSQAVADSSPTAEASGRAPGGRALRRRMMSPLMMRLYMLKNLPLGLMAGLRIDRLDDAGCAVSLPYGWRTTNPFKSMYFAAQAMAAELSTGAMALEAVAEAPGRVALLIVGLESSFAKKATSRVTFTSEGGAALRAAVAETAASGEPATAAVETVGRMANGALVARFTFTWSFKQRSA